MGDEKHVETRRPRIAVGDLKDLVGAHGSRHGLISARELLALAHPGERSRDDILTNPYRRVAIVRDDATHLNGEADASDRNGAYVAITAADSVSELAAIRGSLAPCIPSEGHVDVAWLRLKVIDDRRQAGVRLLDLRADRGAPTLDRLAVADPIGDNAHWQRIHADRTQLGLVGFILPSHEAAGLTIILNVHVLELLLDDGLLELQIDRQLVRLSGSSRP